MSTTYPLEPGHAEALAFLNPHQTCNDKTLCFGTHVLLLPTAPIEEKVAKVNEWYAGLSPMEQAAVRSTYLDIVQLGKFAKEIADLLESIQPRLSTLEAAKRDIEDKITDILGPIVAAGDHARRAASRTEITVTSATVRRRASSKLAAARRKGATS